MELHHLQFTDAGRERFEEVHQFLEQLRLAKHPMAAKAATEFSCRLTQLDEYGGPVSDEDSRRRFHVVLGRDWAPLSFSITWRRLNPSTGEYVHAFNGGLVYHGGSNEPLSISLTPCIWGIHT